jgi:hypothetical protein
MEQPAISCRSVGRTLLSNQASLPNGHQQREAEILYKALEGHISLDQEGQRESSVMLHVPVHTCGQSKHVAESKA